MRNERRRRQRHVLIRDRRSLTRILEAGLVVRDESRAGRRADDGATQAGTMTSASIRRASRSPMQIKGGFGVVKLVKDGIIVTTIILTLNEADNVYDGLGVVDLLLL